MDTCSNSSASSEDSLLAATMKYVDKPDVNNYESESSSISQSSSLKKRRNFAQRRKEAEDVRMKHPNRTPLVIERYDDEKNLPAMEKSKFLVPDTLRVAELIGIIRRRLQLNRSQSLFLLVNGRSIPGNTMTIGEIFEKEVDDDGFL